MGRCVQYCKLGFEDPDRVKHKGDITECQRWSGPRHALEDCGLDVGEHETVDRRRGLIVVTFNLMVSLKKILSHEYFLVSDDLREFCVIKRRTFFCSTLRTIHAFRYFANCMNRKKELSFLPDGVMGNISSFLVPCTPECGRSRSRSHSRRRSRSKRHSRNRYSWLEVHNKHADVLYGPDTQCDKEYQNFLAVDIDFSDEIFEECEVDCSFMYPHCMRDSAVTIRLAQLVRHA